MSHQVLHQIRKEVERGNVKERSYGDLSLFKYTPSCVYDKAWNKTNLRCRGIIFNSQTGTIVGRPFNKFFNVGERPNTKVKILNNRAKKMGIFATAKLDGSMTSIWWYQGMWHCATPGSITSPQARYALLNLLPRYNLKGLPRDITYVCEFISPTDRSDKVVNYGDREDLTLLAAFENKWDLTEVPRQRVESFAAKAGLPIVDEYQLDPEDPWGTEIPRGEEGFVVRFDDGFRVKVKSRWYMKWHRVLGQITTNNLIQLFEDAGDPRCLLSREAPPHAREKLDDIVSYITKLKQEIEIEVDKWWNKAEDHTNFKQCAELFKQAGDIQHILFARMRGNEQGERSAIYKRIKTILKEEE